MKFDLHPQLAADCFQIGDLPLCRVLLMNDSRYPWVILVPRREGIREIYELPLKDQQLLWQESALVAERLSQLTQADKMNVAALGNVVPQLHVHHIARLIDDEAWPAPVWGRGLAVPYTAEKLEEQFRAIQRSLSGFLVRADHLNV